ncbi:MAG: ATP-binding protein [Caldilineaceae bacterium]
MNAPALLATYQLRQRELLLRISRAMTSRLDLPSLLRLILSSAAELVGCRAGLIVLVRDGVDDEAENSDGPPLLPGSILPPQSDPARFQIRAVYGIPPHLLPYFDPLLEIPPILHEEEGEAPQVDPYFADLQRRVRQVEERLDAPLGQVVGLPLLFEEDLLGVIYLFRGEYAFTSLDWQFLQGFADQAAIAVRNARLYHQLETERSRLATIVQSSLDGILILDAKRNVLLINQTLAIMVETDPAAAVGMPCADLLPLENVQGDNLCADDQEDFPADKRRCEGDLVRPGKKNISVSVTFSPLYNEAGKLVNIIGNVHDITRFREEEEIKSTFTSIISHELKTPVALIKGYAQTLARPDAQWDPETAREGLEIIEEEADRLEALINNLLDVSRIQAGGLKLDWADVNLNTLIHRVAAAYRTQSAQHTVEVDIPEPLPTIWADEERLRQVLTNLLTNAIKYSPEGGTIRIGGWLDASEQRPRVVLYVADQGIGIPQAEATRIFSRYYRVDSSLRRGTAGAGLGLFLSKAILDAHGGSIWVRSEPGKGATFFLALPLEQRDDAQSSIAARTFTVAPDGSTHDGAHTGRHATNPPRSNVIDVEPG